MLRSLTTLMPYLITTMVMAISLSVILIRVGVKDLPNSRSSHSMPTPRMGGVAIAVSFALSWLMLKNNIFGGAVMTLGPASTPVMPTVLIAVLVCMAAYALIGLSDDVMNLPALPRFVLQIVVALATVCIAPVFHNPICLEIGHGITLGIVGAVLSAIWIVGYTNVFNFMDGINGLSALTALSHFTFMICVAYQQGNLLLAQMCALMIAACSGFTLFNFPKARLFLGDCGSYFVGCILKLK